MQVSKVVRSSAIAVGAMALVVAAYSCGSSKKITGEAGGSVVDLMKARGLTEKDVNAALKTYTPSGKKDDYLIFSGGGHGGFVMIIGVPSMRILRQIAVFSPESWQGYGYGDQSNKVLEQGKRHGSMITWGDTHHPALSETKGEYDGQYLFINDKANPRIAVVNLKDMVTTQIVVNNLVESEHGAAFVTPNTEYIIESSQYPAPLGGKFAPLEKYDTDYRGAVTFWKFDRAKGRIDPDQSFAIELPPYMQDLADAGKLDSDGWAFINSFNTERSYGGDKEGRPALESGASKNDMDYLHVVNWRKAESVAATPGKTTTIAGLKVISMDTAEAEGLLYFVPEPKSPHGCDVSPDGKDIVIGGKLDTHATVFSFAKIKALIDEKKFESKDPYGVPILPFADSIRGQVELGLGPLHNQFDDKGNVYTSLFIESAVAKWSLKDLKLIEKLPVAYNIGHLVAAEGDTVHPAGKYLVAMNKWSLDRFNNVGPLLPQNFQLVDLSTPKMQLLYDLPVGMGEPHYAQMIRADKIHPDQIYPLGTDPYTEKKDPFAVEGGQERIERRDDGVHVFMTAIRSHYTPDTIRVKEGEKVHLHITNIEQALDATHGFALDSYNINLSLEPGKHSNVDFVADKPGVFPMYCTEFCSALHLEMAGYFLVEPK